MPPTRGVHQPGNHDVRMPTRPSCGEEVPPHRYPASSQGTGLVSASPAGRGLADEGL